MTVRILLPSCIRSNASLMRSNGKVCVIIGSTLISPVEIFLDVARQLRAAFDAAESRAAPNPAGHQLKRPGADFFARRRRRR